MSTFRVFVYGTLKKGFDNHPLLKDSEFVGKAKTLYPYPLICVHKAFPYLIDAEGDGYQISGEVYDVDDDTLARLDELEGYPTHYRRREIELVMEDGATTTAMAYFLAEKIQYKNYPFLREFLMDGDILGWDDGE